MNVDSRMSQMMGRGDHDGDLSPQPPLFDLNSLQQPSNRPLAGEHDDTETVFVLPKTYNGKSVTEIFPEFKHDSVSYLTLIILEQAF